MHHGTLHAQTYYFYINLYKYKLIARNFNWLFALMFLLCETNVCLTQFPTKLDTYDIHI